MLPCCHVNEQAMSTLMMPCNVSGFFDATLAARYGIADFDWSNLRGRWARARPMDDAGLLAQQASRVKALKMLPGLRTDDHTEQLLEFLQDGAFFKHIGVKLIQRQCIKRLVHKSVLAGQPLYTQGDDGESMFIVITGSIAIDELRGAEQKKFELRTAGPGASIGMECLSARTRQGMRRKENATAEVDTVLAELGRSDFHHVNKIDEMLEVIAKFWVLIRPPNPGGEYIHFTQYKKLHGRVAKTIQPFFSKKEMEESAREDWEAELVRAGAMVGGEERLNLEQFSLSMYELVDEWCDNFPSSTLYIDFLKAIYTNVVGAFEVERIGGKKRYTMTNNLDYSIQKGKTIEYKLAGLNIIKPAFHLFDQLKLEHMAAFRLQSNFRIKTGAPGASSYNKMSALGKITANHDQMARENRAEKNRLKLVSSFRRVNMARTLGQVQPSLPCSPLVLTSRAPALCCARPVKDNVRTHLWSIATLHRPGGPARERRPDAGHRASGRPAEPRTPRRLQPRRPRLVPQPVRRG